MFSEIKSIGLIGMNAFPVTAEISAAKGLPSMDIVGLPDIAVQESKLRIRAAFDNSGIPLLKQSVVINLAPAGVKKTGSIYDLPIFTALLSVQGGIGIDLSAAAFVGEISLGGALAPINGALTMAICARREGIRELYLPAENAVEASVVEGLTVYGVENVRILSQHLKSGCVLKPTAPYMPEKEAEPELPDFADVKGQEGVKRALEIAAAGFHNILMIGSPGTGKSMLAKRLPSILPTMSFEESLETTQVHSVAGILDSRRPLVTARPFRPVSHTASSVGLVGGGGIPRPGEISLAHNGVLFLDELPEFDRKTLETLRQPLENREIVISRASGSVRYPCSIMLVAAMNPCPCGNFSHPTKPCTCTDRAITGYLGKISQPVLDRIDIQVEVSPIEYSEMSGTEKAESSERIRERVERAREAQRERLKGTGIAANSMITAKLLQELCPLEPDAHKLMKDAFERLGLSARAYERVLKVARTIADLNGARVIGKSHISEAIRYRSLDRKYWGRG